MSISPRSAAEVDASGIQPDETDELIVRLRELAKTERLLVALDFDGTLAPEVDVPSHARALPEARRALFELLALPSTRVALSTASRSGSTAPRDSRSTPRSSPR
jgi:trehalose 6-phosphate phosphatase